MQISQAIQTSEGLYHSAIHADNAEAVAAAENGDGNSRFVADPQDENRPLLRMDDRDLVPIEQGVEQGLPSTLQHGGRENRIDELDREIAEATEELKTARAQAIPGDKSAVVRASLAKKRVDALKGELAQLAPADMQPPWIDPALVEKRDELWQQIDKANDMAGGRTAEALRAKDTVERLNAELAKVNMEIAKQV